MKDIAPALQITEADLLIIAGLAPTQPANTARPYRNSEEISRLPDERIRRLVDVARELDSENESQREAGQR
ncbi:hypothetical protein ACIQUM_05920 [Amycolatopsis azurea]|uniref:hypothetical protein n=1 Tax=Amycolatopsis azurea TaxID=36819 RepID=UPI0037FB2725